jgi:hypothetical protein
MLFVLFEFLGESFKKKTILQNFSMCFSYFKSCTTKKVKTRKKTLVTFKINKIYTKKCFQKLLQESFTTKNQTHFCRNFVLFYTILDLLFVEERSTQKNL